MSDGAGPKVMVISGFPFSGSTIVSRVLGSYPGVVPIGEARMAFRMLAENKRCGCGVTVRECPFWTGVVGAGWGSWDEFDGFRSRAGQDRAMQVRGLPWLRRGQPPATQREAFANFAAERRRFYSAIAEASGAQLIVDESKHPMYGAALAAVPGLEVRVAHLIRDPRANAHSSEVKGFGGLGSARNWLIRHSLAEAAWLGRRASARLRYEDFSADPETSARRLLRLAGITAAAEPGKRAFFAPDQHILASNKGVKRAGDTVEIELRRSWETEMKPSLRRQVTAITLPLLLAYGYAGPRSPIGAWSLCVTGQRPTAEAPVRVLFVAGMGRSGSTLLERLLGSAPKVFAAGELRYIWQLGFIDDQYCGCGERFSVCPFWREVVGRAFGGSDAVDARHLHRSQERLLRLKWTPLVALDRLPTERLRADWKGFSDARRRLLRAIRDVSGADLVVDSSKYPPYGLALERLEGVGVSVVHLVRDSRAVAYSLQRQPRDPAAEGRRAYRHRRGAAVAAVNWTAMNALAELSFRRRPCYMRVRYEDLVADPMAVGDRIFGGAGVSASPAADGAGAFDAGVQHTVAGNPMRMERGPLVVNADEAWRRELPGGAKGVATAISWPMLLHYRYPLRPPQGHGR